MEIEQLRLVLKKHNEQPTIKLGDHIDIIQNNKKGRFAISVYTDLKDGTIEVLFNSLELGYPTKKIFQ